MGGRGQVVVAIGLGSNLPSSFGDREANLGEAFRRAGELGSGALLSSFYDTAPEGYTEQPRFLNAAMTFTTTLGPLEVMKHLLQIEREMGRDRLGIPDKGPRIIDLDLLLYGTLAGRWSDGDVDLELPHPGMTERVFVLEPLAEIAGHLVHPGTGRTVEAMLGRLAKAVAIEFRAGF